MLPDTNSLAYAESQLESARGQLAQRLRAGEPCRAEELFALYPALAGNAELALQLICTEFAVRMELGRQGPLDEWFARFPQWRDELRNRFEVYADHGARADNVPTAAYADPATEPTRPPPSLQRLGRYDLLAQIGGGGMGVVYKARQPPPLERVVALKLLRGGRLANPEEIRRFSLEAKVAGGLHHPNILPIYELNEHDGQLFLTMPYVEGGSLADRLPHFREPRAAASLVEKIARAVQFLHEHGILHRDLKPSNILLDERGEPLVTDFGLAKLLEGDVQLTETGRVMGTPAYLSPEQAAGRNRQVGVPSDVWALGVILYELLTGRRPFHCEDREELYDLIFAAEPKPPSRLVPGLDRGLENIVLKCLSKEPAERYASAAELADDLRRWLDGLKPVGPTRRRWPARAWKAVRRHPWVSAAVAVLFFVAVGLGAGYALLKPADPLTEGLRKLKNGEQVVWIDETGPPLACTFGYGGDLAHPEKDRRLPFAVVSQSLALLDLVPDPQQDHYHLSVQVEHSDSFDVISGAGVTLGHQTVAAPEGVHHFLLVLIVNKRLEADDPPGASLTLLHFLDDGRLTAQRTHRLGVGTTFADPPADAKESWHQVDAEVTPEKIKLVLDGKPLPDITWAKVDERAKRLMADPKLPYHIEPPAFGPRGALGLYVYRGQGSFRSLVVQPLPGDK